MECSVTMDTSSGRPKGVCGRAVLAARRSDLDPGRSRTFVCIVEWTTPAWAPRDSGYGGQGLFMGANKITRRGTAASIIWSGLTNTRVVALELMIFAV